MRCDLSVPMVWPPIGIVVQYWGNRNFDFYQLRWSRPGRAETQSLVRGSGGPEAGGH